MWYRFGSPATSANAGKTVIVKTAPKIRFIDKAITDRYNLQPAIGEMNGNRGNYQYSQWRGGEGQYGRLK